MAVPQRQRRPWQGGPERQASRQLASRTPQSTANRQGTRPLVGAPPALPSRPPLPPRSATDALALGADAERAVDAEVRELLHRVRLNTTLPDEATGVGGAEPSAPDPPDMRPPARAEALNAATASRAAASSAGTRARGGAAQRGGKPRRPGESLVEPVEGSMTRGERALPGTVLQPVRQPVRQPSQQPSQQPALQPSQQPAATSQQFAAREAVGKAADEEAALQRREAALREEMAVVGARQALLAQQRLEAQLREVTVGGLCKLLCGKKCYGARSSTHPTPPCLVLSLCRSLA